MTLSAVTRRARSAKPRGRRELALALEQVTQATCNLRHYVGEWPTVTELAEELVGVPGWPDRIKNRVRLHRWLTNGTLAGSELRVRTVGSVVRIEVAD